MSAVEQKKITKAIAEGHLETLLEYRRVLHEQHAHAFRWLAASLLAVNAGAAVSILNASVVPVSAKLDSGIYFCVGMILALAMAFIAQLGIGASLQPLHEQISYWKAVSASGARDNDEETRLAPGLQVANKFNRIGQITGFLAVLFFLLGVCGIGESISKNPKPSVPSENAEPSSPPSRDAPKP